MAVSAETEAIINRLKAEGDLIRNTGTNSIRSVNAQLQKFDSVFSSINANISEQTSIMKRQLGIAEAAVKKQRTDEQYEEIVPPTAPQTDQYDDKDKSGNESNVNKKIDAMGDSIASALSLKNLALGAAGLFVGYNLLKGFVDEKTGGGFTAFESNIGNIMTDLGSIDFKAMQESFNTMTTTVESMAESLKSLDEAISMITSIGWADIVEGVLTGIGLLTAYNVTMRMALRLMGRTPGMGGRRGLLRRLIPTIGAGAAGAALGVGADDVDMKAAQQDLATERRREADRLIREADERAAREAAERAAKREAAERLAREIAARQAAGNMYPDRGANPIRVQDVAPELKGQNVTFTGEDGVRYTTTQSGGVVRADSTQGRTIANMGNNVLDLDRPPAVSPRPPSPPPINEKAAGQAIAEANRGLIKRLAKAKISKVILTGIPIIGAVVGAGFAAWNVVRGDFTSAALQAASIPLPAISGTGLDVGSVATEIFFDVAGETFNPANPAHVALMEEIGAELHAAYEEWMSDRSRQKQDAVNAMPTEMRADHIAAQERLAMGGARAFADSGYNPGIGSMSLGSNYYTGENVTLGGSSSFGGNYYTDRNGVLMWQPASGGMPMRASERPNFQAQVDAAAAGGGGNGLTFIDGTTNVSAPVMVSDAGASAQVTNIFGEQGRGTGYSVYGLPGAIG